MRLLMRPKFKNCERINNHRKPLRRTSVSSTVGMTVSAIVGPFTNALAALLYNNTVVFMRYLDRSLIVLQREHGFSYLSTVLVHRRYLCQPCYDINFETKARPMLTCGALWCSG